MPGTASDGMDAPPESTPDRKIYTTEAWMHRLHDVTYLDALLLMCLHYQQLDATDPARKDALRCIRDCERRQMRLKCNG